MPSLSVMILAGGQSRRMGQDKALLKVAGGLTLLATTVEVARSLTSDILIVTPWPERYQPRLAVTAPPTVRFVKEPAETTGPLNGFALGWPQVSADWCLLLACDMPRLEHVALQNWWQWIGELEQQSRSASSANLPMASLARSKNAPTNSNPNSEAFQRERLPKRWEPLCGFYHRRCVSSLLTYLATGQRSFQGWLAAHSSAISVYPSAPQHLFVNWNRPEDLP